MATREADLLRWMAQQDAAANPAAGSGVAPNGRGLFDVAQGGVDAFGKATLGAMLGAVISDPNSQAARDAEAGAFKTMLDFTPVLGDIKAAVHDAPELFAEGHPIWGSIALASALPVLGLPLDALRAARGPLQAAENAADVGTDVLRNSDMGSLAAPPTARPHLPSPALTGETINLNHYGRGAAEDVLKVSEEGSGQAGREMARREANPEDYQARTNFYLDETPVEPRFTGQNKVTVEVDPGTILRGDDLKPFWAEAKKDLPDADQAAIATRAERIMVEQGYEGYEAGGVVQKFTDSPTPRGAANRQMADMTNDPSPKGGGATFSTGHRNLAGQKLTSVALRQGDDFIVDGPLTPEAINEFRTKFADDLALDDTAIGSWRRDDGKTVLDVVETLEDQQEAIRRGVERKQDGVFDLGVDPSEGFIPTPQPLPTPVSARATATARKRRDNRSEKSRARREQEVRGGLTPEEMEQYEGYGPKTRERVDQHYSSAPDPVTLANAALRGATGNGWYAGSGKGIMEAFGPVDTGRFTALLSAMSPNKSVEDNLKYALMSWKRWNDAGRPTDPDQLRALSPRVAKMVYDPAKGYKVKKMVPTPESLIQSPLPADFENSITAFAATAEQADAGIPSLLSGPKVGPFYANLFGKINPITNDTHMARAYGTLARRFGGTRTLAINAAMRNGAKEFEKLTGVPTDARGMQEMIWVYTRGLTNAAGHEGKALDVLDQAMKDGGTKFAGGRTLQDRIEDSAALGDMMASPKFADLMRDAGAQIPGHYPPTGIAGNLPEPDITALRDIAQRIDANRAGKPLFGIGGALGIRSASDRLREEREGRR